MFTKAEIEKLSIEQREVVAKFEISVARQRQQLLEQARGLDWHSRCWLLFSGAIVLIIGGLYCFIFAHFHEVIGLFYLVAGILVVNALFFRITLLNQRLDGLLKLLDFDRQNQNINDSSKGKTD